MYEFQNLNVKPLTIAEMENVNVGEPEFKQPIGFGVRPLLQAKRLVDLDNTLHFSAKKNQANCRNATSARKFTQKKSAGLSQNMSTSKKLSVQKRTSHAAIKRSIDFNNVLKGDNSFFKPDSRTSIWNKSAPTPNRAKQSISNLNLTNNAKTFIANQSISFDNPKQTTKKFLTSQNGNTSLLNSTAMDKNKLDCQKNITNVTTKTFNRKISKSEFERRDKFDSSSSSMNISSDKENDECQKNRLHNKISSLITSHCEEIKNVKLDNDDMPKALKKVLQNNLKITLKVLKMSSKLVENNIKLINMYTKLEESEKSIPPTDTVRDKTDKKTNSRSPLKSLPISRDESSDDVEYQPYVFGTKSNDLRKVAIMNSERNSKYPIKRKSPMKKSMMMYTSFKSSMEFLKTPMANHTVVNSSDFETPNTRSRTVTSNNVQRQLEKLFDS